MCDSQNPNLKMLMLKVDQPGGLADETVFLGGGETGEFFAQADSLIDSWSRPDLLIEKYIEPGVDHFDLVNRLTDPTSELFRRVKYWLK